MATLSDLKTRIITETNRDDLQDELAHALTLCIQQSIDFYKNSRFWFNELRTTTTAAAGVEYTDIPPGYAFVDELRIVVGGVRYGMTKHHMDWIEEMYSVPLIGQPTDWAEYQFQARMWPTPNINYTLIWFGVSDVTPALDYTDPNSTNDWLTHGYDLIDARARFLLYRDYFRDEGGMAIAKAAETESFSNLKSRSNRLVGTGRIIPRW